MMERRHIVTAHVRKEWSATKTKGQERTKHVAVLLGDPAKPDALKPSCTFDDDDFYTIDQMKAALRELKGYQFTYLCKHDTMIQDLGKLKGKVDYVLNLCDEGFNNDPRRELHVPALLEMLGSRRGQGCSRSRSAMTSPCARYREEMGIPVRMPVSSPR